MRIPALAAALLLAGCDTQLAFCPGEVQGTLTFAGTGTASGSTCAFFLNAIQAQSPPGASFPATVSFLDAATAGLCIERPLSDPKTGPRSGDTFSVSSSGTAASGAVGSCTCALDLDEVLSGTLQRDGSGRVSGFAGGPGPGGEPAGLTVTITRADPLDPVCDQSADCPPAGGCTVHYDLHSP